LLQIEIIKLFVTDKLTFTGFILADIYRFYSCSLPPNESEPNDKLPETVSNEKVKLQFIFSCCHRV